MSMSADQFETSSEEVSEDWLVTYADSITLLMAFFVVMFSISKPDSEKLDQISGGLSQALNHGSPFNALAEQAEKQIKEEDENSSDDEI